MDHRQAKALAAWLNRIPRRGGGPYTVVEHLPAGRLSGFHHWADDRPCEGAWRTTGPTGTLWLIVVLWGNPDRQRYYLVAYPENRSGPKAEIHKARHAGSGLLLQWRYVARSGDGRNPERVALFKKATGEATVFFDATLRDEDVTGFLDHLFFVVECRIRAELFDNRLPSSPGRAGEGDGFPEGRAVERWHLARERDPRAVAQAKQSALDRFGRLVCSCCKFDFHKRYGAVGKDFIEAHHARPLSTLGSDGGVTRPEDLDLVCSNCHRMLHRHRPWLTVEQLRVLLTKARRQ